MSDLIGAIPVPGPTQITGVCESGGSRRRPFWRPMRKESPDKIGTESGTEGRGQELEPHQGAGPKGKWCRLHVLALAVLCGSERWLRTVELDEGVSVIEGVKSFRDDVRRYYTLTELAIENCRGRIGGKTSNIYSFGILTWWKSARTSWIVRRTL